ncbi:hypothetical protein [Planctomicrobium sp. SH527]|uniref:hypothetical protein n=1 Tax=Planctomicrobium sp. SH527 TaxID=3448123 RepID=UPI003F5BF48A
MWCEHCQTDVATEVSADGQSLLCTTCRQPAKKIVAPSLHPETKSAREFLERWAREQQVQRQQRGPDKAEPVTPPSPVKTAASAIPPDVAALLKAVTGKESSSLSGVEKGAEKTVEKTVEKVIEKQETQKSEFRSDVSAKSNVPAPTQSPSRVPEPARQERAPRKRKRRIDSEHSGPIPNRNETSRRSHRLERVQEKQFEKDHAEKAQQTQDSATEVETKVIHRTVRIEDGHTVNRTPHFNPQINAPSRSVLPGRSEAFWGQLMAYVGVGMLTVGTVFVLWGYFGDIERYASTGWLVATAGQMLLLLGIVTLVGGGMQQTTHEVSQRIEHLGGRIIRIEQSTDKILKGPTYRRSRRKSVSGRDQEAA